MEEILCRDQFLMKKDVKDASYVLKLVERRSLLWLTSLIVKDTVRLPALMNQSV